eukprot:g19643.t1
MEREEKQIRSLLTGDRLFQSTKANAQSATARGLTGGKRTRPSQVEDGGKRVKVGPVTQSTASSPTTQIGGTPTTQGTTLLPAVGEESAADFLPSYDGEGGSEQGTATGVAADLDTTMDAGEHYNVCKEAGALQPPQTEEDNSFFTRLRNQRIREMYQTTHTFDVETRIRTVNCKGYNIQVIAEGGLPTIEQMLVVEEHGDGSEEENVDNAPEDADAPTQHVAAEEHAAKVLQQYRLDGSMVRDTEEQVEERGAEGCGANLTKPKLEARALQPLDQNFFQPLNRVENLTADLLGVVKRCNKAHRWKNVKKLLDSRIKTWARQNELEKKKGNMLLGEIEDDEGGVEVFEADDFAVSCDFKPLSLGEASSYII